MGRMVRKQLYIEQRQQDALARLAALYGVTESELIRTALDGHLSGGETRPVPDPDAWSEAYAFMEEVGQRGVQPRTRDWKRDDLYEERLTRCAPGSD